MGFSVKGDGGLRAEDSSAGTVLICDDAASNLSLLEDLMGMAGYRTMAFTQGELALPAAVRSRPDLILLDIKMPGMDGCELCRRLKADPATAEIPVIFVSALVTVEDKVRAFAAGGADYITKPYHQDEVLARAGVQLSLSWQQEAARRRHAQLEAQLNGLRTYQVEQHELIHLVVHELRTPLAGIIMAAELLLAKSGSLVPPKPQERLRFIVAAAGRIRDLLSAMTARLIREDVGAPETGSQAP
jgi:two-component system, sensor histidine kinase and response regulator